MTGFGPSNCGLQAGARRDHRCKKAAVRASCPAVSTLLHSRDIYDAEQQDPRPPQELQLSLKPHSLAPASLMYPMSPSPPYELYPTQPLSPASLLLKAALEEDFGVHSEIQTPCKGPDHSSVSTVAEVLDENPLTEQEEEIFHEFCSATDWIRSTVNLLA